MGTRWKGQRVMAVVASVLVLLTACAGPAATNAPTPSAREQPPVEDPLRSVVQELLANQEAGRLRTVSGIGYVLAPVAVPLADGDVSLIPSSPDLEAALARFQRQWHAGRRAPLPYGAFQTAFARLTAHRLAMGRAGGETFIRFATADDKGRFSFDRVPEGRWLLVADMSSPVSTLLWTVPVEVGGGDPPLLFLIEGNLLLEARKADQTTPAR